MTNPPRLRFHVQDYPVITEFTIHNTLRLSDLGTIPYLHRIHFSCVVASHQIELLTPRLILSLLPVRECQIIIKIGREKNGQYETHEARARRAVRRMRKRRRKRAG